MIFLLSFSQNALLEAKEQLLPDNFNSKSGPEKEFTLEQIESKLNENMPKLPVQTVTVTAGTPPVTRQDQVKWTSTTCMSDETSSVATPCGWYDTANDPTCTIT